MRTPAYGVAKAAMIHYTRTQAAALIGKDIRVNCVAPGSIEFPGGIWDNRRREEPAFYNATLAACPGRTHGATRRRGERGVVSRLPARKLDHCADYQRQRRAGLMR